MSRIGKKMIAIPAGVSVQWDGKILTAKGPKGSLTRAIPPAFGVNVEGQTLTVTVVNTELSGMSAHHGLNRSLVANMIEGVSKGYLKELEIQGVGFKASIQGKKAVFALGFSHPKEIEIPVGLEIKVAPDNVNVAVSGPDKQLVGEVAARIKSFYPVEPYKGKGVRYKGQYVRRKVGKTVA